MCVLWGGAVANGIFSLVNVSNYFLFVPRKARCFGVVHRHPIPW